VSQYERQVTALLAELFSIHKVVVLTGGSGLYIKAVCEGIDELPDMDISVRESLTNLLKSEGLSSIRNLLFILDPVYARKVDLANPARIIRAIEVTMQTGIPYSSHLNRSRTVRNFNIVKIALNLPREELHSRINHRVDEMIEKGLEEEARSFYPLKHLNSLNTVGYKELFEYFEGKMPLSEAIEKIKTNTRRYARRQITWFKSDSEYKWLQPDSQNVINYLEDLFSK